MSATIKTIAFALVCILATAFVVRTCFPTPEDSKWKDQFDQKAKEVSEIAEKLNAERLQHESDIEALRSELSGHMDSTATVIAHKEERISALNSDLASLEDELETLTDYKSKYENVLAQNITLKKLIVEKDAQLQEIGIPVKVGDEYKFPDGSLVFVIIDNYEKRLGLKDEIIANGDKLIREKDALIEVAHKSVNGLTLENRKLRRQGRWLKLASAGLGGYCLFDVLGSALKD